MDSDVSVVIPVRNGAALLSEAIESVLHQSLAPREVIVIDDGSSDESSAVAIAAGAACFRQEPLGQAAARNAGFARASGGLVAFLDADDVWPPDKLALQLPAMQGGGYDAVFGSAIEFRERVAGLPVPLGAPVPANVPGAMLISRKAFAIVGPFRADWRVGEVIDWYARAVDCGLKIFNPPATVLWRRIHSDNLGRRTHAPELDYLKVVRGIIARRRIP